MPSRVVYNHALEGDTFAGEMMDLGPLVDVRDCAQKCCDHSSCEVAYIAHAKCFAVACYTKELCRSRALQANDTVRSTIVYINKRNNIRLKDRGK